MFKKTEPTRSRAAARAQATTFGNQLRDWLQARQIAAGIRGRKKKQPTASGKRGVDRVPERYRVTRPKPEWIHLHTSPSRAMQRRDGVARGRVNQPYTNLMRDVKSLRSGRLRKELRP